VHRPH